MLNTHVQPRSSEQGFTLVELAIVMVIIGLLIGGILKGQELISSAKVSATVSQLKGTDAALNTFFDKYNSLPGDILNPTTRLPNCAAAPCNTAGTGGTLGDNQITNGNAQPGTLPGAGTESGVAFVQLAAADLISGINPSTGATFNGQFPSVKAGGGMWVSYAQAQVASTTLPGARHYAAIAGTPATVAAGNGALNATTVAQIDRKLDDGLPQSGSMQTMGTNCFTGAGATAVYNEGGTGNSTCSPYIRVLN